MRRTVAAIAALAALTLASTASAAITVTTFTLNVYDSSSVSFTDSTIGTITVTDNNGVDLDIVAALNVDVNGHSLGTNYEFRDGNSDHNSLVFLADKSTATLSNFFTNVPTTGLHQVTPAPFSDPPFGSTWNYAVDCNSATGSGSHAVNGCVPGYTAPPGTIPTPAKLLNPTKIGFRVAGIDFSDLKSVTYHPAGGVAKNIWFAVDVIKGPPCTSMCTGNVGATWYSQSSYAPEPETWALLILGFGAVGADLRRRRAARIAAAA